MDKSLLLGFITREERFPTATRYPGPQHEHPCSDPVQGRPGRLGRQDGRSGRLQRLRLPVDPTPTCCRASRPASSQKKQALLQELKGKPNTTLDGRRSMFLPTLAAVSDVGAVQQNDAGGVGLFRTEFVYLNSDYPTEDYSSRLTSRCWKAWPPKRLWCAPVISAQTRLWST